MIVLIKLQGKASEVFELFDIMVDEKGLGSMTLGELAELKLLMERN